MNHPMTDDDQLVNLFARIDFADEPAPAGTALDDARRGHRRLVRRRAALSITGGVGIAAVAAATALIAPIGSTGLDVPERDTAVLAPPPPTSAAPVPTTAPPVENTPSADDGFGFPATRTSLLDAAKEHLDPDGEHLPASLADVRNAQGGGGGERLSVGTKLAWTAPDETGMGMIQVAVASPGYVNSSEHALEGFSFDVACAIGSDQCVEQTLPGTDLRAWVATGPYPEGGFPDLELAVVAERADGSLVGLAVNTLFGNNSTDAVSEIGITLDQAFAFVADPDIVVAPEEAEAGWPDDPSLPGEPDEALPDDYGTEATP